ncbi:MAG: hypothetical protein K2Q26_07065 [Bdellovibrionales bacterium]|nr:hypothetical protein [Bdellovibrionales bacterium]
MWKLFVAIGFLMSSAAMAEDVIGDFIERSARDPSAPAARPTPPHSGPPLANPNSRALNEIRCIQQRDSRPMRADRRNLATLHAQALSPSIQRAFNSYGFSVEERRHFYAQMMKETGALTSLSETQRFQERSTATDTSQLGMETLLKTTADDHRDFRGGASNARHSSQFGDFRGRGLIQITGCDNFLSILHYLNLKYSGAETEWQNAWYASHRQEDRSKQIGRVCNGDNQHNLREVMRRYQERYNMDLDLYGAISDPRRFAMLGGEFQQSPRHHRNDRSGHPCVNQRGSRCISSEDFLVDASMAFWRGRFPGGIYRRCRGERNSEQTLRCITKIVTGAENPTEITERLKWYRIAEACVR